MGVLADYLPVLAAFVGDLAGDGGRLAAAMRSAQRWRSCRGSGLAAGVSGAAINGAVGARLGGGWRDC